MPGGKFHSPIWTPYALYGTIDYMYGWPAWNARIGFTAAQGSLNAIEFVMDVFYLWVVFANGKVRRGEKKDVRWFVWEEKKVEGAGLAVLVVFAAAIMTLSKTVLYCKSHLPRWIQRTILISVVVQGSTKHFLGSTILDITAWRR